MSLVRRPTRRDSADAAGQLVRRPIPGPVATTGTLDNRPQATTIPTSTDVVALHKQWDSLTPARRKEILSALPSNVVSNYAQAIEDLVVVKTKEGKTMRIAERMRPLVDFMGVLGTFASALDAAFPGAGLALNSMKGIFLASKARLDLQDYLVELVVDKISANLPLIRRYRDEFQHSPELMSAALDIYGDVLDIGNRATKFFYDEKGNKRHSLWILAASNWSSCKDDLEVIRRRFDAHLGNFGRAALFAHAQDARVGLQLLLEDGEQHHHDTQAGLQLVLEDGKKHHHDTQASLELIVAGSQQQKVQLSQLESGLSEQTRMLMEDKSERGRELDSLQAKNRRELLRWIATQTSKLECAAIHDKLQRAAVPGTGDWLLDHPLYRDWSDQRGPGGLWISGKWGTGKSVLASDIIRRLMNRCQTDETMACAYIYCSSEYPFLSSDTNKNTDATNAISYKRVLGSILHQLYGSLPLDQDLDSLVTQWGQGAPLLEVHVEEAIRDVIAMFPQAFVVIDGLDEFQRTDDDEFAVLCKFIGTLVGSGPSILILSRPEYADISNAMSGTPVIQIDGKANESDIIAFVHEQTSRLGRMGRYEEQIQVELVVRANGVFRWISAVVSYIRHIKTPRARAEAVKTMPPQLKDVYAKTLERILNQTDIAYNYAAMALLWVTHAWRSLTVKEMAEALSIEPGMTSIDDDDRIDPGHVDELCENCQGFLELSSSGQYQLPHDSVRDFLVGPPDPRHQGLEAFWTLRAQTHERIAEACLTYLSLDVFSDVQVTSRKEVEELHLQYPLLRYASSHWGDHTAKLGSSIPPPIERLVHAFLKSDNRRELNLQLLRDDDVFGYFSHLKSAAYKPFVFRCARTSVPLHLVAGFGLEHFLPDYFSDEAFRSPDGGGILPIDLATLQQKHAVFDWMLSHCSREPSVASEADDEGTKKIKSDTGGKGSPQGDIARYKQPFDPFLLLPYVLATWETWAESLRNVLELGFDPNAIEPTGFTPLHAAVSAGNLQCVKVLLEMGADSSARGPDGQTAFLIAAYNRERAIAKVLFDHGGFDISEEGWFGFNALHYFAEFDHELADEFLRRGGRFQSSETGRTPLHFAASAGNMDSVRVLCRWLGGISEERLRLELAKQRSDGITALQVAAYKGSVEVVKVLVEEFGDDLVSLTPRKETVIHLGAMADEPKLIDFVLERCGISGVDPNAQSSDGATALHIAATRGHANFVTALLKAYPNLNTALPDKFGRVPLHSAALSGDVKMVEMLKDFSYDIPDQNGSLPFHCAARSGNLECVKALCRLDILERPASFGGHTALHAAAAKGHTDIVRYLLSVGHQHGLRDNIGRIPLHVGALFGNLAVVFLLLESGSDVRCLDKFGRTPLSEAFSVWPAQPKLVFLLLGEDRELLNVHDEYGLNCAYICAGRGTPELWAQVWPRGYLAKSPDLTEQSLVSEAASYGNLPMLEHLVETDGAAFDDADICGWTPLFHAVKYGYIRAVDKLLCLGADVHVRDKQGRTPLHIAIIAGYPRIAQALLAAGSDHTKRDDLGLSVEDYAERYWRFAEIFWHLGPRTANPDDINHIEMLCSFVERTARAVACQTRESRAIVKNYIYEVPRQALALALCELNELDDAGVLASELTTNQDVSVRCRICKMRSWGRSTMMRCGDCPDVYLCEPCYYQRYSRRKTKDDFSISLEELDIQSLRVGQALWPFVRFDAEGIQHLLQSDSLFTDWVLDTDEAYKDLFEKNGIRAYANVHSGAWDMVAVLATILNATGGETGGSTKSSPRKLDDLTPDFHRLFACSGPFYEPVTFPCRGHQFLRIPLADEQVDGLPSELQRFITGKQANLAYYTHLAEKYARESEEYELLVSGQKATRWTALPDSDCSVFGNYYEGYDYDNSTWLDSGSDRPAIMEDGHDDNVSGMGDARSEEALNSVRLASEKPESERGLSTQNTSQSGQGGTGALDRVVEYLQGLEGESPEGLGTAPDEANPDSQEPVEGDKLAAVRQHSLEDVVKIDETGGDNPHTLPQEDQKVIESDFMPDDSATVGQPGLTVDSEASGEVTSSGKSPKPVAEDDEESVDGQETTAPRASSLPRRLPDPKNHTPVTSDSSSYAPSSGSSSGSESGTRKSFRSSLTFDAYPIDQYLADMDWWENPFPVVPLPKQKGVITDEAIEFAETRWKLAKAVLASRHRNNPNAVNDWMRIRGFEVIVTESGWAAWRDALRDWEAPPVGGRLNPYRPKRTPFPGWFTNYVRARLGQPPVFLYPREVVVEETSTEGWVDWSGSPLPFSETNLRVFHGQPVSKQGDSDGSAVQQAPDT